MYHLEMDNLTRLQYIKHVKSSHSPVRVASQCPLIFTTLYTNHMVIRTCYHPKESERSRQKYKGNPFLSVKITRYFCLCHFASTTKTITGRWAWFSIRFLALCVADVISTRSHAVITKHVRGQLSETIFTQPTNS